MALFTIFSLFLFFICQEILHCILDIINIHLGNSKFCFICKMVGFFKQVTWLDSICKLYLTCGGKYLNSILLVLDSRCFKSVPCICASAISQILGESIYKIWKFPSLILSFWDFLPHFYVVADPDSVLKFFSPGRLWVFVKFSCPVPWCGCSLPQANALKTGNSPSAGASF